MSNKNILAEFTMYNNSQTNTIIRHIKMEYDIEPEFLWPEKYPSYCVFRHGDNRKWFALVATTSSRSLGTEKAKPKDGEDKEHNDTVEIINLNLNP